LYELIPCSRMLYRAGNVALREKLSWQYPLVEMITGLFLYIVYRRTAGIFWLFRNLIVLSHFGQPFSDLKYKILPDSMPIYSVNRCLVRLVIDCPYFPMWLPYICPLWSRLFFSCCGWEPGVGYGFWRRQTERDFRILVGVSKSFMPFISPSFDWRSMGVILILAGQKKAKKPGCFGPFLMRQSYSYADGYYIYGWWKEYYGDRKGFTLLECGCDFDYRNLVSVAAVHTPPPNRKPEIRVGWPT